MCGLRTYVGGRVYKFPAFFFITECFETRHSILNGLLKRGFSGEIDTKYM